MSIIIMLYMPRRRSNMYTLQVSTYGRVRQGYEWRKFTNGVFTERFGTLRHVVCRSGKYYDVVELCKKTFGKRFRGLYKVPAHLKLRPLLVTFRKETCVLKYVAKELKTKVSNVWRSLVRNCKISGEKIEFAHESPVSKPSDYYFSDEIWSFPQFGKVDTLYCGKK